MSEKIEITKEMLMAARDYIELGVKEAWCKDVATKCFDRLKISAGEDSMPEMYMVNSWLKARYLMAAFAAFYLQQDYEALESDASLMSAEEYDRWAKSHVFNQIERWKRDGELRDKCFDILADYRDLEKHFSTQINGMLSAMNDSVVRQSVYTQAQMKDLPQLLEQLKDLQGKAGENGQPDSTV